MLVVYGTRVLNTPAFKNKTKKYTAFMTISMETVCMAES